MRIQELERLVGIDRATIRFYEKEGLITPARSENGYRDYSDADAEELKRIKLLRELSVSLDTIRALQEGREDFAEVMRRQCRILEGRRDQMEQARRVCERISADGIAYAQLDTVRYQSLLEAPLLPAGRWQGSGGTTYREQEYREPHPWRRYFARFLDHNIVSTVLWFIVVVLLRWRPASDLLNWFIVYISWFVLMPLEAACLHFWGTTPGKWIFGIRVEAAEGGKLYFNEALARSWKVFRDGMCFNIPLLNWYCMFKAYKAHITVWDNDWDEDCEITFRDFGWKNIVLYILAVAATVGVEVVCQLNAELPRYRSNELKISEFAANYNFYDELLMSNTNEHMDREGQLADTGYTQGMVLPDGREIPYDPYTQFEYELDGDTIDTISFHHTWYDRNSFLYHTDTDKEVLGYWIPGYCRLAAMTAVMSQGGADHQELVACMERLLADMSAATPDGYTGTYGNVTISWDLELELFKDYPEDSTNPDVYEVTLDLKIEYP